MDLGLALVNLSKHLDFDEKALNSKRMFKPTPFCIMLLHKRLKPQLRDVINELPPYLICHVRVDNEVHLFFCNFIQVNSSNRLERTWLGQIFLGGIPIVSWLKKQKNCTNILIKKECRATTIFANSFARTNHWKLEQNITPLFVTPKIEKFE